MCTRSTRVRGAPTLASVAKSSAEPVAETSSLDVRGKTVLVVGLGCVPVASSPRDSKRPTQPQAPFSPYRPFLLSRLPLTLPSPARATETASFRNRPCRHSRAHRKSGVAAACLALELGADVVGADADPRAGRLEKNADAKKAASAANAGVVVRTDLGAHENFAASFAEADIIVLSPGVALTQPQVAAALARGEQEVLSELAFAARSVYATERDFFAAEKGAAPTKKLAVTGTNGKSTTCAFAAQLVRACGKRAFVGGNLGTPLSLCALEFLRAAAAGAEAPPYDALVIEISSYQLEHPGWRSLRFDAACVTTLSPDHLERHGDMATYAAVKARVFAALRGAKKLAVVPVAEDVAFETEDGEDDKNAPETCHCGKDSSTG